MPSWNIHIAQTERLLERGGAVTRAVRDANAFLFGNLVPDIMVGYMVPGIDQPVPYRKTHFAAPEFIPKPREREFWDTYVAPQYARLTADDLQCARVLPTTIEQERNGAPGLRYMESSSTNSGGFTATITFDIDTDAERLPSNDSHA